MPVATATVQSLPAPVTASSGSGASPSPLPAATTTAPVLPEFSDRSTGSGTVSASATVPPAASIDIASRPPSDPIFAALIDDAGSDPEATGSDADDAMSVAAGLSGANDLATASATPADPAAIHSVAVPASAASSAPPPAHQLAPALMSIRQGEDGAQQMTVRLNPSDLGMVQVKIDRAASGPAHVEITAERPETLQALRLDETQLHRTLDQAGVPSLERTISFHVAGATDTTSGQGNSHDSSNNTGSNTGNNGSAGTSGRDQGGSAGGRDQGGSAANRRAQLLALQNAAADEPAPQWRRVGLNITA